MTIGSTESGKKFNISLSEQETEDFKAGKQVVKLSGDSNGVFKVVLKLTRPRNRRKRYPAALGYDQCKNN